MAFRPAFADLSHHNSFPNSAFADAAAAGLIGVILKATEGTDYVDDTYALRKGMALAAGLQVASYHYLKASGGFAEQMEHFVKTVNPAPGERMVIDYEEPGLTADYLMAALNELMHLVPECQYTVYGGQSFLMETLGHISEDDSPLLANTSLWVARYTSADTPGDVPPAWPTWTAWQYTDGSVGGDPKSVAGFGKCDLNAFNGGPEGCRRWFDPQASQPQPSPPPPPPPDQQAVLIDIVTPPGVEVMVTVNGMART